MHASTSVWVWLSGRLERLTETYLFTGACYVRCGAFHASCLIENYILLTWVSCVLVVVVSYISPYGYLPLIQFTASVSIYTLLASTYAWSNTVVQPSTQRLPATLLRSSPRPSTASIPLYQFSTATSKSRQFYWSQHVLPDVPV